MAEPPIASVISNLKSCMCNMLGPSTCIRPWKVVTQALCRFATPLCRQKQLVLQHLLNLFYPLLAAEHLAPRSAAQATGAGPAGGQPAPHGGLEPLHQPAPQPALRRLRHAEHLRALCGTARPAVQGRPRMERVSAASYSNHQRNLRYVIGASTCFARCRTKPAFGVGVSPTAIPSNLLAIPVAANDRSLPASFVCLTVGYRMGL